MSKPLVSSKLARLAVVAIAGAIAMPLLNSAPAQADPRQHTNQLVGVGSDTTQEIMNAGAGEAAGLYYSPVASNAATGRVQLSSWNALPPGGSDNTLTCIAPRPLFNAFQRPNGSTEGVAALSRAIDGQPWNDVSDADPACASKPTGGIVNFARSSSSPGANTNQANGLTYIPFGRDALTYAYYSVGGATALPDIDQTQLRTIFQTAPDAASDGKSITTASGTAVVIPCDIQVGSGTRSFFYGSSRVNASNAQLLTSTDVCNDLGDVGGLQENKPNQLKAKGDAYATANAGVARLFIVGHSVSAFLAQSNNVAPNNLATGVVLGSPTGAAPFTVNAGVFTPNATYYNSTIWGRNVFNVVNRALADAGGNTAIKQIFVGGAAGTSSALCNNTALITNFGFLNLPVGADTVAGNCGSRAQDSDLVANPV